MINQAGKTIPLTVVGGFLGSGKTTLINRILQSDRAGRTAVLVNDFGSVNVDERMIAAAGGQTIALTNGCVCCSIGDDLTEALIRVSEMHPVPEWIVIETSGVADPRQIAQVGVVDPILVVDGVMVLVDASTVEAHMEDSRIADTVLRQIEAADMLILNKADLVGSADITRLRSWLSRVVPEATIHVAMDADIPWELVRSPDVARSVKPRGRVPDQCVKLATTMSAGPVEHDHIYATWTYETSRDLSRDKLRLLLDEMPPHVLRAKGLVRLESEPAVETIIQFAGHSRALKSSGRAAPDVSRIVFISTSEDADFAAIRELLLTAEC
ncbi:CobW family GTP-binding protein [Salinisphaera aquimarina]|uniref:CobW family GTP-binding protein n=1 Tax=Salinisphaera aquimarina TaxID=2094031 RepID=A0ABV7ET14_9GAMM